MRTDTLSEALLKLAEACLARHLRIGTAESCTGGLISELITERPTTSPTLTVEKGISRVCPVNTAEYPASVR